MMPRTSWRWVATLVVFAALGVSIVMNLLAGPASVARPTDMENAKRAVPAPSGGDEHAPLAPDGYVSGNGVIEPRDRETKVAGQVAGRIAAIRVKEGDIVEAGTPLVEMESTVEKAALAAAEADVTTENAMLARTMRGLRKEDVDALVGEAEAARARAEMSAEILARTQKLFENGAVTADEIDRARGQADVDARTFAAADARRLAAVKGARREDVVVAQAELKAAIARRDQARAALERLVVRAPIAGTVLQLKYRIGEYYNPGPANPASADPIALMGDLHALRARIDVDERDVARVRLGDHGFVTLSAFPGRRFAGTVVDIGRRMGRKNVRTDDPVERLDVKILEVVLQLDETTGPPPGIRVVGFIQGGAA